MKFGRAPQTLISFIPFYSRVLIFNDELVEAGTNSGPFIFVAPDGVIEFDVNTGMASFGVELSIKENEGNMGFPNPTHAFTMGLRHTLDPVGVWECSNHQCALASDNARGLAGPRQDSRESTADFSSWPGRHRRAQRVRRD